tara:strand:- start:23084 stop:24043 length:960 start_codon:yes stop_codon:yes gene_type:complete
MTKKITLLLIILITSIKTYSQEYVEVLRASDNNILVNPALAGIDGRNSITILDTRSLRGSRFNSALSYASASFRMTDNMIYCPAPGYFSTNSGRRSSQRITNNHFQTSFDLLNYSNDIFRRLSAGMTLGYRQQLNRDMNIMFAMKTSISQDKFNLLAWDTSDPLYQNWSNGGFKQTIFGLTPGVTIYTRNFLIGLSTKIGLTGEEKYSYQEGKFDPFGNATIATVSYDLPVGGSVLSLSGNYVIIDDEPNFYSFGAKIPLSESISIMGGSRDLVEIFGGLSLNFYGNTSLEVFINNFIGNSVRNNVPIYSIRLKAFDIF